MKPKPFEERSRDDKISLLKKLIAYEGRHSLTTPVRYGLLHPLGDQDGLPFETRRSTVYVGSRGRQAAIPVLVPDRRTALKTMEKMLAELEGGGDAQG